jgi:hypothetical protein
MHKIITAAHKSITTRRAMPQMWFDMHMVAGIAIPLSMWTQNHYMLLIAIALQLICVVWYMIGYQPVRKPARRAATTASRTRRTTRTT